MVQAYPRVLVSRVCRGQDLAFSLVPLAVAERQSRRQHDYRVYYEELCGPERYLRRKGEVTRDQKKRKTTDQSSNSEQPLSA